MGGILIIGHGDDGSWSEETHVAEESESDEEESTE
jgi:hypothetical protein